MDIVYLLWSNKHAMWWRPNSQGYTDNRDEAGEYSEEEAVRKVVASAACGIREQVTCMVAAPVNWQRPHRHSYAGDGLCECERVWTS